MMRRLSRRYLVSKAAEVFIRYAVRPPRELFTVPGYLRDVEGRFLYWLSASVPENGRALEIGSFKGRSSGFIAAGLSPGSRLACVDTWMNDAMPYDAPVDSMPEFERNLIRYRERIDVLRGHSVEVAKGWNEPLDLLFVDGDHSYGACRTDIIAWKPFVRPGGWIAFH